MASGEEQHLDGEFELFQQDGRRRVVSLVEVTGEGLRWRAAAESGDGTAGDLTGSLVTLKILATTVADSANSACLSVHYVYTKPHLYGLLTRRGVKVFSGPSDICNKCSHLINDLLQKETQRPKRLLVFVNPASGSSSARNTYKKKVAPVLELMGVQAEVIYTQHVNHASEVLAEYDLTTIDVVVAMGGDGTFLHTCNALLKRAQKEAGVDLNDPRTDLVKPPVCVAMIPAGTGNAISDMATHSVDPESSVLCLVLGHRITKDIHTIHCNGHFVEFSCLLVGYGLFAATVYASEKNRALGRARYLALIPKFLFRTKEFEVEIDYLPYNSSGQSDWQKFSGTVIAVQALPSTLMSSGANICSSGHTCLSWIMPCSMGDRFRFLSKMMKRDPSVYDAATVGHAQVTDFRVRSMGEYSTTKPGRILDWDGEVLEIPEPCFEMRLHQGLVDMVGMNDAIVPREQLDALSKQTD